MLLLVVTLAILVYLSPILAAVVFVVAADPARLVGVVSQALAADVPRAARPHRGRDDVVAGGPHRACASCSRSRASASTSRRTACAAGRSSARGAPRRSSTCASSRRSRSRRRSSTAAVLVTGGYLFWHGRVTIGTVAAVALYLTSLFEPVGRLGDWYSELQSGRAALTKIVDLLETPVTVRARRARSCRRRATSSSTRRHFSYDSGPPAVRRRLDDDQPGRAPRPRRRDRRRKVDAREAAHAPVRPAGRLGAVRRHRPARRDVGVAARADRLPPAGGASLRGLDRRQRPARAAGRLGRGGRVGARADRCARALQRVSRTASTRTSRRAASGCHPASGS